MSIHTFGDSHSSYGWPLDLVTTHHLGPVLCYSFGKDFERCDISKYNLKNGDSIIFCFGEIDCRCHIHKHIDDTNSLNSIIDSIVQNYIQSIKQTVLKSKLKFKKIYIYNVVPPVKKHTITENHQFPLLGSDSDRKKYVLEFNKALNKACKDNDFIFFDIYNYYTDNDGFLKYELSDKHNHINDGFFIRKYLEENLV